MISNYMVLIYIMPGFSELTISLQSLLQIEKLW